MDKTRLMLVDDHKVVRAGLRALFEQQEDMEVVAEASSVPEALACAGCVQADIILLDLTLPGGGGMGLIEKLLAVNPPPHILVLTMHDDPAYARAALAAGATGYVVKSISEQDLLGAVRAVRRGRVFIDLDDETRTSAVFGIARQEPLASARLSEREMEVLRLLGHGHTNQAVAEQLDLSPKTVATYRARIAEKLGLKTTADFVRYATDNGLLDTSDR